jgi:hypothetical protein
MAIIRSNQWGQSYLFLQIKLRLSIQNNFLTLIFRK